MIIIFINSNTFLYSVFFLSNHSSQQTPTHTHTIMSGKRRHVEQKDVVVDAASANPLRVSNDLLTVQLRQVLRAGTNVVFDTTHADYTLVSSSGGYPSAISNPQNLDAIVLDASANMINVPWLSLLESTTPSTFSLAKVGNKIQFTLAPHASVYDSSKTYAASLPFACIDSAGIVYSTSPTSSLESHSISNSANYKLAIESAMVSTGTNVSKIPVRLGRSSGASFIVLEPESANVPTLTSLATVNGVSVNKVNFSGAQTLATPSASHDDSSAINMPWDCTLVMSADIVPGDTSSKYVEFMGNSNVYAFSVANSAVVGNLAVSCGETHLVPLLNSRGVFIFRISQSSAFTPYLDVFFNGANIYSRPYSGTVTAKSLGLAGLLRVGDSANTSSTMSLHHLSWYDCALSDQECLLQSQYIAVTSGLSNISIGPELILSTDFKVRYVAAAGSTSSYPTQTSLISSYTDLTQSTPASRPLFNNYATFNYRFTGNVAYMDSGALAGAAGSRYCVAFMFAPGGACAILNEIASLTLDNTDKIYVVGSYSSSVLTIGLQSGATTKTFTLAHKALTNDELLLVLNCNNNVYTLTAIRYDTKECASCSLSYSGAGLVANKLTIGRTVAPASNFPYNIGDLYVFTRILPGNDAMALVDYLTTTYSLPMSGTALLQ